MVRVLAAIALRIMAAKGVVIDDLYGLVRPRQAELLPRAEVHFQTAGYDALAEQVAAHVRRALESG